MNLYQKLAKIRAISDIAKKDKRGYNYTYADITQILANVTAGMKKYALSPLSMDRVSFVSMRRFATLSGLPQIRAV